MLLAQRLQLCIGVEEVVDVVGRSREGMNSPRIEILLNRLPNEMDRLRDDADGLFILIMRGLIETGGAPASRGGRVNEVAEIPNPDVSCHLGSSPSAARPSPSWRGG